MDFQTLLNNAGDRIAHDEASLARYEFIWNCAIRAAAESCQSLSDRHGMPERRQAAQECAEEVMSLWTSSSLKIR